MDNKSMRPSIIILYPHKQEHKPVTITEVKSYEYYITGNGIQKLHIRTLTGDTLEYPTNCYRHISIGY